MEKLVLCSKSLYNIDMVGKTNKIHELENKLKGPPIKLFNSFGDFQCFKIRLLKEAKTLITEWCNEIPKRNFTNKSYLIRGLKTCNYDHFWHQHTITPQFSPLKILLVKLLYKLYNIDYPKKINYFFYELIDKIFIGVTGTFYTFTQLDLDFEENFIDIIFTSFEKQIYMHLFLKEKYFELVCNSCGEVSRVSWDNICENCKFIKTF